MMACLAAHLSHWRVHVSAWRGHEVCLYLLSARGGGLGGLEPAALEGEAEEVSPAAQAELLQGAGLPSLHLSLWSTYVRREPV
jgi:hypothetical protein